MTRLIEAEAIVANGLSEADLRAAMLDEYPFQALGMVTALQARRALELLPIESNILRCKSFYMYYVAPMEERETHSPRAPRPTPIPVRRGLQQIGTRLATWRRLRGLTAEEVAARAGVSRRTLAVLESGAGNARLETILRVARVLGVLDDIVAAFDPYNSDVGRLRADEQLPRRVRRPHRPTSP